MRRPKKLKDYETGFVVSLNSEPTSYAEAMSRKDTEKWKEAVETELRLLKENNT